MTLKQLHRRLGEIIAMHDARGWSERNDQKVIVRLVRVTPSGRLKNRWFLLNNAYDGSLGFGGSERYIEVDANEKDEVGRKQTQPERKSQMAQVPKKSNHSRHEDNIELRQMSLEAALLEEIEQTLAGGIAAISSYSVFLKSVSRARSNLIAIARTSEETNVAHRVLGATLQQMGIEAGIPTRSLESVAQMLRVVQQSTASMLEATKNKIHEVEHERRRRSSQTGRRNKQ